MSGGVARAASDRSGLGRSSWIAVLAIGVALAVLSLSRMQVYAVYANERDAVRTLRQLAGRAQAHMGAEQAESLRELAGDDFDSSGKGHWSAGGSLLRRNGYLFDLGTGDEGLPVIRAWPWAHAETGLAAYAIAPGGALQAHTNEGGLWSGPDSPPAVEGPAWLRVADQPASR